VIDDRTESTTDHLVAGVVIVRLEDAQSGDRRIAERQLGRLESPPPGSTPDLILQFADLVSAAEERIIGDDEAAWSDEFVVLRGRFKSEARVALRLDATPPRLICQRGLRSIPHLVALVNLVALRREIVPMHASAFVHAGTCVLATGWSKGGKTELVLGALAAGGQLVGDEWVYAAADGSLTGLGEPIRLWDWQLRQLPRVAARVASGDRVRLTLTRVGVNALSAFGRLGPVRRTAVGRTATRIAEVGRRQLDVQVPVDRLIRKTGGVTTARPDIFVLVNAWNRPDYSVRTIDTGQLLERMTASLIHERRALLETYDQYRFAFPGRSIALIEDAPGIERRLLGRALGDKPAIEVVHPRPFDIERLWTAVEPWMRRSPD
jgi:hypothetical protein